MKISILVDSDEFWQSLNNDMRASKEYIYIQTLSFEGDRVGKKLSDALLTASPDDKRVLADFIYSKYMLNDKFVYHPRNFFNKELRSEAEETIKMFNTLKEGGVNLKLINPDGPLILKFPQHNHKKLIAIDDKIAYIGGINFSDHNFFWHDMMLRIEDSAITEYLKEDFLTTWSGQNKGNSRQFGCVKFHNFDGISNKTAFKPILELIRSAEKSIFVESPHITFPFYGALRIASQRGIAVTLITPEINNWSFMNDYMRWECARSNIDLWLYKDRLTHLKSILIDDKYLIVGSSNFDYLSYCLHQEIVAVIDNEEVILDFKERIIEQDLRNSNRPEKKPNILKGYISNICIKALLKTAVLLSRM